MGGETCTRFLPVSHSCWSCSANAWRSLPCSALGTRIGRRADRTGRPVDCRVPKGRPADHCNGRSAEFRGSCRGRSGVAIDHAAIGKRVRVGCELLQHPLTDRRRSDILPGVFRTGGIACVSLNGAAASSSGSSAVRQLLGRALCGRSNRLACHASVTFFRSSRPRADISGTRAYRGCATSDMSKARPLCWSRSGQRVATSGSRRWRASWCGPGRGDRRGGDPGGPGREGGNRAPFRS